MNRSCGNPKRRRRRRPRPQSRLLRLWPPRRRRPQRRRLPPRPCPFLPQPRPLLPQMNWLLPRRRRRLPHLRRLPLQVHRFQRRVARVNPLQSRQRTVVRRGRIAIPGLVAAHHPETVARALWSPETVARALWRTWYQNGSAAIPAWGDRVSVASVVATGAVVNTDVPPRQRANLARAFSVPIESERRLSFLFRRVFFTRTGTHFAGKRSNIRNRDRAAGSGWVPVAIAIARLSILRETICMEFPGSIPTTAIATHYRTNRMQAGA